MSQKLRLMIADDYKLFRECLAPVLTERGFTVTELPLDLEDVLDKAKTTEPDIVLINIDPPNDNAPELTRQISLELPQVKVIVLHLPEVESIILQYIEAGAKGYTLKGTSLQDLITTIQLVSCGETVCSPKIAYHAFSRVAELTRRSRDKLLVFETANLTVRETEILRLVSSGLSNKQIARQLYLSLYTVKNHVHNILEKLEVRNRSEAICYALDKGLLTKKHPYIGKVQEK